MAGHNFNINWEPNGRGGFYAGYFDWTNCGNCENYKQIEISFKDGLTSEVKTCLKFSSDNAKITHDSKSLIKDLQDAVVTKGYQADHRLGRTTICV